MTADDDDIDLSDPIVTKPGESLVDTVARARECTWRPITGRTSWCEVHGCLRHGSYTGEEYRDPDTGKPIRLTSTGYYRPGLAGGEVWEDGPPPSEYLVTLYGKPYTYLRPKGYGS